MPSQYVTKPNTWGQVELNRTTAQVTRNMESQAPAYTTLAADTPIPALENGMFLCVVPDTAGVSPLGRICVLPGAAPATAAPYMVYSERKQYDEREGYADFVDIAEEKVDGVLYPRLFGMMNDSDVWTTNTLGVPNATTLTVGQILYVGDDGYLTTTVAKNIVNQFVIVKVYTLPDGQKAVKLMSQAYVA